MDEPLPITRMDLRQGIGPVMTREHLRPGEKAVSIRTAAEMTGVEIHTLRYWESEFEDFLHPIRTPGGQRRFRGEDIQMILTIRRLVKEEMFSLAGARKWLERQNSKAA